jgi:hypothetical protein
MWINCIKNICESYVRGKEMKTYNCWNDVEKLLKPDILLKWLDDKSKTPNSNNGDVELKIKSILILPLMLLVLKFLNKFPTIIQVQTNSKIDIFLYQLAKTKQS